MPEVCIDFDRLEVYEAGAILVTLLALPGAEESDKARGRLHRALCAMALRACYLHDPDWAEATQPIKPAYALYPQQEIDRDVRTLERRLRDRMIAARMAIPFLKEAETGTVPPLPVGVKRLSLNQLSVMMQEQSGQADPENVESRIWRPSLPVIHLAAATQVLMRESERVGAGSITVAHLMACRDVIEPRNGSWPV